jgi:hypothetical protein
MSEGDDKSVAWQREHYDPEGRAYVTMATWLLGRWEARVWTTAQDGKAFPTAIGCDSAEGAKTRAEELLQDGVPHDCGQTGCGPWTKAVNAGEVG